MLILTPGASVQDITFSSYSDDLFLFLRKLDQVSLIASGGVWREVNVIRVSVKGEFVLPKIIINIVGDLLFYLNFTNL